ncbi:MAG: hypothetical protein IK990_13835 [Ruminiclostridium sp.]|nr:hypothetical protein [Ruminiclostridium sp.]MBP3856679.1 hypothetical protein [Ruminiclostridium sp.]
MAKKRITEIDIIKGVGILTIAAVHLIYRTESGLANHIFRALGWLLIGLFFMLSGYTYSTGKRTVRQSCNARLRYLLFPAAITEIILLIVGGLYCMLFHGYALSDCLHDALVTFLRPELCVLISEEWGQGGFLYNNLSPSWFIWSMLWTELIFIPTAEWCGKGDLKVRGCISAFVLTAVQIPIYMFVSPLPWLLQLVPLFTVFMLMGMLLHESGLFKCEWRYNAALTALISFLGFAASVGVFSLGGDNYFNGYVGVYGNGIDILLPIIQLVPGIIAFYALAKLILRVHILSDGIIWIGRHTLTFLMCHCFFAMIAADMMKTYNRMGEVWYLEDAGLTLTPEIFWKSVAGYVIAVICCISVCIAKDTVAKKQ